MIKILKKKPGFVSGLLLIILFQDLYYEITSSF